MPASWHLTSCSCHSPLPPDLLRVVGGFQLPLVRLLLRLEHTLPDPALLLLRKLEVKVVLPLALKVSLKPEPARRFHDVARCRWALFTLSFPGWVVVHGLQGLAGVEAPEDHLVDDVADAFGAAAELTKSFLDHKVLIKRPLTFDVLPTRWGEKFSQETPRRSTWHKRQWHPNRQH